MLLLVFVLPLVAALLCLALNRVVPTRWLGVGAAVAYGAAGAALLVARAQGAQTLPARPWIEFDGALVRIGLGFDGLSWLLGLIVCAGGALVLLGLAVALPAHLRGFGGLFAAVMLLLLASLAGLASQEPLLLPVAWSFSALLGFAALRASGISGAADALPGGLVAGLLSALALLGATLAIRQSDTGMAAIPVVLACWTLAGLLVLGAPPFHAVLDELAAAPADLPGALLALGLPLLGGTALMRFAATNVGFAPVWSTVLVLLGLAALLACAAGALAERRARRLIGWQFSAQMGLLLIALGVRQEALTVVAPPLLANAVLTTLVSYLAIAPLERRAGTDDLTAIGARGVLVLPGLALLVAAASAVGIPGTWGFWARRWLLETLPETQPWSVAPILAGSVLMALAYLAPLTAFWRRDATRTTHPAQSGGWTAHVVRAVPVVAALPLLILGLAPQLGWRIWGMGAQRALAPTIIASPPALPEMALQVASGAAAILLLALPIVLDRRSIRRIPSDPEIQSSGVLIPQAIGESLRALVWAATPERLFRVIWSGLLTISRGLNRALALFEQRYYLAGLLLAVVVVILLML